MYISIVVPVYNEESMLEIFHTRITEVMQSVDIDYEIMFVNDGSKDRSLEIINELAKADERISFLNLSRNFGKESAMSAGIDIAEGDALVVMDADLQDPPELIPEMVEKWREGYDTVYAKRVKRDADSYLKRVTAVSFYKVIGKLSKFEIPRNTGDFRLISRRSVLALRALPENNRFMKGLFAWIGYRQTEVVYERPEREAGETKFNYWKLWNFALDGITSFTTLPLKLASYIGCILAIFSFFYGILIIVKTLLFGDPVPGYPSLMVIVLFLGGIQLVFMGILGEYMGRMFDESKRRPLYLLDRVHRSSVASNQGVSTEQPSVINTEDKI